MSTSAFRAMLICTVCNLMLDISTVYTVTHLDTVPPQLNRFLHQLFIASVIMVLFFNFLYVLILNRNQERLTKRTFGAVIAPLAISAAVIIAGKLEFSPPTRAHIPMVPWRIWSMSAVLSTL